MHRFNKLLGIVSFPYKFVSTFIFICFCCRSYHFFNVWPPESRLLAPEVFKPSCSTPFLLLSTGPFHDTCFQLPSYSLFLPNRPFSCMYLQHSSSLYSSSCSLWSPSDTVCFPCAASRVGGGWDPGGWGSLGVQHASSARTSPRRAVGLARPSQSAGRALP